MADVKRLNYFTSQFLVEKDFKDEQAYLVGMRQRHNQLLHTWGVADGGLQVNKTSDRIIAIGVGMAIDKDGQEIVLLDTQSKDVSEFGSNADVYLTVKYQEVSDPSDHYSAGGVDNYIRITERPLIGASTTVPAMDGSAILLAKVSLDGSGNVARVDNTVRRLAGSAIDPTIDLVVRNLTVNRNAIVTGNVGIGTSDPKNKLQVEGNLHMNGNSIFLRKNPTDQFDVIKWNSAVDRIDIGGYHGVNLCCTGGATNPVLTPVLSITNADSGRVGIAPDNGLKGKDRLNLIKFGNDGDYQILHKASGAFGRNTLSMHVDQNDAFGVYSSGWTPLLEVEGGSGDLYVKGSVGIGTSKPSHKFHVVAADAVGLFESSGGQAYLRLSTNEGLGNRVEITNRPGGRLSLWTSGGGDVFNITKAGNVGILTDAPGFRLDVADRMRVRQGPSGTAGIWMYQAGPKADQAFVGMAADNQVGFWGNTGTAWGLTMDTATSTVKLLASSNPLYITKVWNGFPDAVTNAAEISNDLGIYKTLMIVGNRSANLGRRVSVWDRFEVNGTFVNNSSIEAKQDVRALSEEDYRDIHNKVLKTPLYRYRFKARGIDQKLRMGVISEESPAEILDETGKYVSLLDYVGFLFAALKAQAKEIHTLGLLIGDHVRSDSAGANERT